MKKKYLAYFVAVAWQATAVSIYADVIYDVDFEDPPHVLGSPPAAGGSGDEPTSSGNFTIATGVADFTTQVALMESDTVGGGMAFAPGTVYSSNLLIFEWEWALVLGDSSENTLQTSVQIKGTDGPNPRVHVSYLFDGTVRVTDPVGGQTNVATFVTGQSAAYQVLVDLDNDAYDFSMNGSTLLSNRPLQSDTDINIFAFDRPFGSPSFAIDNVQWQIIPEPSTLFLMLVAGVGLAAWRRHSMG